MIYNCVLSVVQFELAISSDEVLDALFLLGYDAKIIIWTSEQSVSMKTIIISLFII